MADISSLRSCVEGADRVLHGLLWQSDSIRAPDVGRNRLQECTESRSSSGSLPVPKFARRFSRSEALHGHAVQRISFTTAYFRNGGLKSLLIAMAIFAAAVGLLLLGSRTA